MERGEGSVNGYETIRIESKLTPERLLSKLQNNCYVRPKGERIPSLYTLGRIAGNFEGNRFNLHRVPNIRNSFVFYFYGEIVPVEEGSRIVGEFKMHPLTQVLTLVFRIMAVTGLVAIAFTEFKKKTFYPWDFLMPVVVLFGAIFLPRYGLASAETAVPEIIKLMNQCARNEI